MRFRFLFAILFFTWLTALLVLTYYPNLPDVKVRVKDDWFRLDYIGHLGFYAALMVFFLIWQAGWRAKIPGRLMFWTILGGLVLGTATEFSQIAIPGRSFNVVDMACNSFGILVGVAAVVALSRNVRRKTRNLKPET
jgi:VanZ family protein